MGRHSVTGLDAGLDDLHEPDRQTALEELADMLYRWRDGEIPTIDVALIARHRDVIQQPAHNPDLPQRDDAYYLNREFWDRSVEQPAAAAGPVVGALSSTLTDLGVAA